MSQEEKLVREKISARDIVAGIITLILIFLFAYVTRVMAMAKYWIITGAWLPFIWLGLIITIVGKLSPRLRMNKTFFILILTFICINTGKSYFITGVNDVNWISTMMASYQSAISAGQFPPGAIEVLGKLVPDWLLPTSKDATARYYFGGGEPIWDPLIGPIVAWSVILIGVFLVSLPMVFLLLGPQWWDDEKLPFPVTIPTIYVVNNIYGEKPEDWGMLFGFKRLENKIFWIFFVIGLILGAPFTLSQIFPAVPLGFTPERYGQYRIDPRVIFPVLNELLPGAQLTTALYVPALLALMLLPFNFIVTFLIFRILFGFIYNVSAVKLGFVAAGQNPAVQGPFPHQFIFGQGGAMFGLAVYVLWLMRGRIKRALTCFSNDYEVNGISMRYGMTLMIIGLILLLGVWIAAGMHPLIAVVWFILATGAQIAGSRIAGEFGTLWIGWHGHLLWQLTHPIGTGLGIWGLPPQRNTSLALMGLTHSLVSGNPGPYANNGALQQSFFTLIYGVARGTKVDIRKFFNLLLVSALVMIPVSIVFDTWFMSHVGLVNTGAGIRGVNIFNRVGAVLNMGTETMTYAFARPISLSWMYTIVGGLIIFAIGILRTIFPWFFISPVAFALAAMHGYWIGWLNPIIALVVKYIFFRILGARRATEIIVPLMSGLAVGLGGLYPLLGAIMFSSISIPNIQLLWK